MTSKFIRGIVAKQMWTQDVFVVVTLMASTMNVLWSFLRSPIFSGLTESYSIVILIINQSILVISFIICDLRSSEIFQNDSLKLSISVNFFSIYTNKTLKEGFLKMILEEDLSLRIEKYLYFNSVLKIVT